MIKFTANEDNKQFISVAITDGTEATKVFDYISACYPTIKENLYKMSDDEILLNLENNPHYEFSCNALRTKVAEIAKADVYTFCVDTGIPNQRYTDYYRKLLPLDELNMINKP